MVNGRLPVRLGTTAAVCGPASNMTRRPLVPRASRFRMTVCARSPESGESAKACAPNCPGSSASVRSTSTVLRGAGSAVSARIVSRIVATAMPSSVAPGPSTTES